MKKIKKIIKKILMILGMIFILFLINLIRNYFIITKLSNMQAKYLVDISNIHINRLGYSTIFEGAFGSNDNIFLTDDYIYEIGKSFDQCNYNWIDIKNKINVSFGENASDYSLDNDKYINNEFNNELIAKEKEDTIKIIDFFDQIEIDEETLKIKLKEDNTEKNKIIKELFLSNIVNIIKVKKYNEGSYYELKYYYSDIEFDKNNGMNISKTTNYNGIYDNETVKLELNVVTDEYIKRPVPGMNINSNSQLYQKENYIIIDPDGEDRTYNTAEYPVVNFEYSLENKKSNKLCIRKYNDYNNYKNYSEILVSYDENSNILSVNDKKYNFDEYKLVKRLNNDTKMYRLMIQNINTMELIPIIEFKLNSIEYINYANFEIDSISFENNESNLILDFNDFKSISNGVDCKFKCTNESNDKVDIMTPDDALYYGFQDIEKIKEQLELDVEYEKCTKDINGIYHYGNYSIKVQEDEYKVTISI